MYVDIKIFLLMAFWISILAFKTNYRPFPNAWCNSQAHSSLDTETVMIKTSVVDEAFDSYADRKYDTVISLFLDELENSPYAYSRLYDKYRKFFNLGFTSLLRRHQRVKVNDLIDIIVTESRGKFTNAREMDFDGDKGSTVEKHPILSHDTIHILLKDALRRKQVGEAESIYAQYFNIMRTNKTSPPIMSTYSEVVLLDPILRTLNLMIDGCRDLKETTKASFYIGQMSLFRIQPDPYTFTSLVRMAKTPKEIIDILINYYHDNGSSATFNDGKGVDNVVSYPLVRCCIESLGKLGHPNDALEAACFFLNDNSNSDDNQGSRSETNSLMVSNDLSGDNEDLCRDQSIYMNDLSGDALLASLLAVVPNKRRIFAQSKKKLMAKWKSSFNEKGYQRYMNIMQYSNGCTAGYIALLLSGAVAEVDVTSGQTIERIQFGNKGYCLLLSYLNILEDEIVRGSLNGKMNENGRIVSHSNIGRNNNKRYWRPFYMFIDDSERYVTKSRLQKIRSVARKRLRLSLMKDLKHSIVETMENANRDDTKQTSSSTSDVQPTAGDNTTLPAMSLKLNGRLCDALLRSFSDDANLCRYIWRNDVYPLARLYCKNKDFRNDEIMNEIIEKSFEALIYSSGRCCMPEIGLEIVNTVRKRNWDDSFIKCLSKNYLLGFQKQKKRILSGFESDYSLRIELGIFAESRDEDTSIRLILKDTEAEERGSRDGQTSPLE